MSAAKHIVILQNGLSGHHWRMTAVATFLQAAFPGTDLAIVISDVNNMMSTYFGIEPCGERLREFVRAQCRLHPLATKISFIGHSLGGLMIRHCIGLLQEDDFFGTDRSREQLQPVLYVAIASPHLGVRSLDPIRQALARWVIRGTGEPLLLEDAGKLLLNMSKPGSKYMLGLGHFQLVAYGNLVGDKLVPFETACLCDSSSVQLYAVDGDPPSGIVALESVGVGQLVRVVHPEASGDVELDDDARVICNNLRRLPWKSYATNLHGWLNPHNAICNKGMSQTLGFSSQTVVLENIAHHLSDATGLQRADHVVNSHECNLM
jgi:hypothetical protein